MVVPIETTSERAVRLLVKSTVAFDNANWLVDTTFRKLLVP